MSVFTIYKISHEDAKKKNKKKIIIRKTFLLRLYCVRKKLDYLYLKSLSNNNIMLFRGIQYTIEKIFDISMKFYEVSEPLDLLFLYHQRSSSSKSTFASNKYILYIVIPFSRDTLNVFFCSTHRYRATELHSIHHRYKYSTYLFQEKEYNLENDVIEFHFNTNPINILLY